MAAAKHIVERAGQLRIEQARWEGVRQQASAKLLELGAREAAAGPDAGFDLDNEQDQLRSQIAAALFHMQEIRRELADIRALLEAEAREADAPDPERERLELVALDDALKEQLAKEAADKAGALRKEELLKADALEKEQRDREFFETKETGRLEALAKDEQDLAQAERDKQEPTKPEQSDLELLASINEEWRFIQAQIAEEWEYIDQEIQKEMEYNVEQTLEVIAEVVHEVKMAFANPVDQKEAKEFLEARRQALDDFVSDEVFRAAPADHKELWLKDKFNEQWRAEEEAFGDRGDNLEIRGLVKQGLADLHGALLKAVEQERKIETTENKEVETREEIHAATKARFEKAGYPPHVLEQNLKQLDAAANKQEQATRERAEAACQEAWDKAKEEMRAIADEALAQAEQRDADKRREAQREMLDAFRSF